MTQAMSKLFPKEHAVFADDKKLQAKIKSLEDRIEQRYLVHQQMLSLKAILEILEAPHEPGEKLEVLPKDHEFLNYFNNDSTPKRQIDIDRDVIWEMAGRSGKGYVLSFLSTKLRMSLEVLFGGIVVGYIQMFAGGDGRAQLNYMNVFKDHEELKVAHKKFDDLRNKQYAHKGLEDDRHRVSYFIDNKGAIAINAGGAQDTKHYHLVLAQDLNLCLTQVARYLEKDVEKRGEHIITELTESQRLVLIELANLV